MSAPSARDSAPPPPPPPALQELPLYFERQFLQRCGVHALNNLLQRAEFSSARLDALCTALAPGDGGVLSRVWNPHRTLLLGNFDANVLLAALCGGASFAGCLAFEYRYVDARASATFAARFPVAAAASLLLGFLVNTRSGGMLSTLFGGRHWFVLRAVGGRWFEIDSLREGPSRLDDAAAALARLAALLAAGGQVIEIWQGEPPPYLDAPPLRT